MALKSQWKKEVQGFEGALVAKDCYCKVGAISGDKRMLVVRVDVFNGDNQIDSRAYHMTPSVEDGSANFIKQAYLQLKTLPEFSGAEDC